MAYKARDAQCGGAIPPERHVGLEREDVVSNPTAGNPYVDAHLARRAKSQDLLYPLRGFGTMAEDRWGPSGIPGVPAPEPPRVKATGLEAGAGIARRYRKHRYAHTPGSQ